MFGAEKIRPNTIKVKPTYKRPFEAHGSKGLRLLSRDVYELYGNTASGKIVTLEHKYYSIGFATSGAEKALQRELNRQKGIELILKPVNVVFDLVKHKTLK